MAKYLIRLDDACPTANWDKWDMVFSLLDKYSIKPIIAVIPDNADPAFNSSSSLSEEEFFKKMRNLQIKGYKMAIHGYNHVYTNDNSGLLKITAHSEFAGETYDIQLDKLRKAQFIFHNEGLESDLFVAPSHSFDKNTIKCLKALGISNISDGLYAHPYSQNGCRFIPCQLWYPVLKPKGIWTICVHPETISELQLSELENFICNNSDSFIQYNQCPQASPLSFYDYYVHYSWYLKRFINKTMAKLKK